MRKVLFCILFRFLQPSENTHGFFRVCAHGLFCGRGQVVEESHIKIEDAGHGFYGRAEKESAEMAVDFVKSNIVKYHCLYLLGEAEEGAENIEKLTGTIEISAVR